MKLKNQASKIAKVILNAPPQMILKPLSYSAPCFRIDGYFFAAVI